MQFNTHGIYADKSQKRICSRMHIRILCGIPLALIGYWLGLGSLVYIGLGLYAAILLFQLLTLPVE